MHGAVEHNRVMVTTPSPTSPESSHEHLTTRRICGYEVIRRVHTGLRTSVYLARSADDSVVALRVFHGEDAAANTMAEVSLSQGSQSRHLDHPHDIGLTTSDEPVLVSERLGARLSTQLENAGHIAAGSIVTLLGPLVGALRDLHRRGRTHGAVDTGHIRLSSTDGRPVFVGADGGERTSAQGVRDDLLGLASIAELVLHHADEDTRRRGMSTIVTWLRSLCADPVHIDGDRYADIECRIFALADPLPFAVPEATSAPVSDQDSRRLRRNRTRHTRSLASRLLEGELSFSLEALTSAAGAVRRIVRDHPRAVRLGISATVIFALSLTLSLVLLPDPKSDQASSAPTPTVTVTEVRVGVDLSPSRALVALLKARRDCYEHNSAACLSRLYEPDSSALETELAAIVSSKADPFTSLSAPADKRAISPIESKGGVATAVVSTDETQPVSVLIVCTETGWVIRDVFDA